MTYDARDQGSGIDDGPLDDLLRHSDIVTLRTPLTAQTRHLLDGERINRMKPGALMINTGRGDLVDNRSVH